MALDWCRHGATALAIISTFLYGCVVRSDANSPIPPPSPILNDHAQIHAIQTNEIFLLVGEIMAQIATAFFSDKQPGGPQEILATARAPFSDFVQEPWWDVVVPRTSSEFDGDEEETSSLPASEHGAASDTSGPASFADTLRALCEESSGLLRRAFALTLGGSGGGQLLPAALEEALSAEMFSRVVGMFEQNNVGVRAPSPIPDLLRELLGRSSSEAADHGVCCRPHERVPKTSDAIPNRSQDILEEVAGMVGRMMHGEECDDRGEGAQIGCCGQEASGKCGVGHDGSSSCEHPSPSGSRGSEEEKGEVVENTASAAVVASKDLGDNERREEDLLAVIRDAVGVVDDVSDSSSSAAGEERELFAPLDGTALYSLICCMNHSCRPNCVVRYPGRRKKGDCRGSSHVSGSREFDPAAAAGAADPLVAEVLLLRDVAAGEELVQSYVTREMGLVERRMALQDYGFLCSCPQCVEEETARATSS